MRNKLLLFVFFACLVLGGSVSVTYAYLTGWDFAGNDLGMTENEIHIEEKFEPPDDPGPGTVITKSPCIVNDSAIPVYVRASVRFSNSEAESFCMPLDISSRWQKNEDGYYYYDTSLSPGERTVPMFETISIKEEIAAEDLVPFDVLVYAESVQCFDSTMEEAWSMAAPGLAKQRGVKR